MSRARPVTTTDLAADVRSQIDEANVTAINLTLDLLPALNRGVRHAGDILARRFAEPLLTTKDISLSSGAASYSIPEDALGDRVVKVEIVVGRYTHEVKRIPVTEKSRYETSGTTQIPTAYYVEGRNLIFVATPSGTYPARIHYVREMEELVPVWGRITKLGGDYVVVDTLGDVESETTPVTDSAEPASYINIVDAHTGEVKATAQVKTISGTRITLKTLPTRTSMWNRAISSAADALAVAEADDYICEIGGSCVLPLEYPLANFITQYAVSELNRKLGNSPDLDFRIMQEFERQVEKLWSGRETGERVKRKRSGRPWPIVSP